MASVFRKGGAIGAILVAIVGGLVWAVFEGASADNLGAWSHLWYGDEAVRAGSVMGRGNTHYHVLDFFLPWRATLRNLRYSFMALIGEVYFPTVFKKRDFDLFKETDSEGQFCRSLLDYFWVFPTHPMNRGTRQDMNDFVRYCRLEYQALSAEEQHILGPLRTKGRVPHELLLPSFEDPSVIKAMSRRDGVPPFAGDSLSRTELEGLLDESMRSSTWEGLVPEVPQAVLDYYGQLDLRKLPRIASEWKEIREAIEGGRMARFDAGPLLSRELFNATPADIAEREGEAAARIPVLSDGCTAISLRDWGRAMEDRVQAGARVMFSLADRMAMAGETTPDIPEDVQRNALSRVGVGQDYCDTGYVHTRRVPRLHASLPDIVSKLGMQDDVLRVQSYLWMGAVRGGFHYDEEANVYVQLTGKADVWLVPQNYTRLSSGGSRIFNPPSQEQLSADPTLRQVPFIVLRLRPGDGLVFPASTYHLVCAQSPERVALNFFFMPKWRRMEYSEADWYWQEARRPNGLQRLALRQIWARSFSRLWDEKQRGLIVNAGKNEYL